MSVDVWPIWSAIHSRGTAPVVSSWLANQQRFHAGVLPAGGDAADDVGGGFRLALALFHPHHNGDGRRLVGDGIEAARQGALLPGLTGGGEHVGEQHGLVQREGGRIGIAGSADHADDGGGNGANGARALVDFEDADAVMVFSRHAGRLLRACAGSVSLKGDARAQGAHAVGCVAGGATA